MIAIGENIIIEVMKQESDDLGFMKAERDENIPTKGLVVSVGEKVTDIVAADVIYFAEYSGVKIPSDRNLMALNKAEVLAKEG